MKPALVILAVVVLGYSHGMMYLYGRDAEARQTIDALQLAWDAWALAEGYRYRLEERFGVADVVVRACLLERRNPPDSIQLLVEVP